MIGKIVPGDRIRKRAQTAWTEHVLPAMREYFFDEDRIGQPGSGRFFELTKNFFRLGKIGYFRERMPEFDPKRTDMRWIPINQDIEGAGEMALPEAVLDRLIEKAQHRVIVNFCGCRKASKCQDYPVEIGCLMMGESALQIPLKSSREVGVEEAKAHVRKAIDAGLIPIVGKARIDNDIFMIPDVGKLLTVCLCCECCCITRYSRYATKEIMDGLQRPVDGLSIRVTDDCVGCGRCMSACYLGAIDLQDGKAVIGELCRVCGRCALHCPQHAIKLQLDNPNAVDDVVQRIESMVDF